MASAYVFEYVSRLCRPEVRLWLPPDPPPVHTCGEAAACGIFEGLFDPQGRVAGPGTWVAVTGLPEGYTTVTLDPVRSAGIAAVVTPLSRDHSGKPGSACFGVTLLAGYAKKHRLCVRFGRAKGEPDLPAQRDFDVLGLSVPAMPPMADEAHGCGKEHVALLERVPAAVMAALLDGGKRGKVSAVHGIPAAVLGLSAAARGIKALTSFVQTGPSSGELGFLLGHTADDEHLLAVTARCPKDGRTISAAAPPFFFQLCPRIVLRGPAAARSLPAEPPARFRIGPFDGMEVGQAELVHAAFGDLRRSKQPYKGKSWTFQLRVQPYRSASGGINGATPRVVDGALETTEGGDLGVVIAADKAHPHLTFAAVDRGTLGPRQTLRRTGNPLTPADGTFPEMPFAIRGAGVEETVSLPSSAVVFYLDEHELTDVRSGLLRSLDTAQDHAGTRLLLAVHALAPCGCVSRLELDADAQPELSLVGGLAIGRAHP